MNFEFNYKDKKFYIVFERTDSNLVFCGMNMIIENNNIYKKHLNYNDIIAIHKGENINFIKDTILYNLRNGFYDLTHEYFKILLSKKDYELLNKNNFKLYNTEEFIETNKDLFNLKIDEFLLSINLKETTKTKKVSI